MKQQRNDKICQEIKASLNDQTIQPNDKLARFKIIKKCLYVLRIFKRSGLEEKYLVPYIPDSLFREAFKIVHDASTAGHKDAYRTLNLFRKNFYNALEKTKVNDICQKCHECIRKS